MDPSVITDTGGMDSSTNSRDIAEVICSFPLSGQYGVGSRVLFYLLVFLCVFAQKNAFLRGASLAAALLFPALAAIHAIVLAVLSVNGG